ncbi:anhydro-N-acetylmuramic acid kinase [Oxobacter pfennigii]|uniref:Anhydro-N-acetylmuramic acid kinase n=1 Tax=Oxobacter pfennigii TaxID=36849 RepID=A0A0P8W9R3_9CLOT|nr:GNAT family N-acetyltransferase [Oxobacter pfennigii]KPU44434.1 anhydro-N-acetylmuramic acid kinase [Oxobacter pfennigii]
MKIETDRLLLRKHRIEDYERFWGMITDPIAKRFTGGVTSLTYEQRFKLFCEDCSTPYSEDRIEFAVVEKSSMMYIGYCGCRASKELGGYELFYGYCRDSWGKGYGFEAADSAVAFFFEQMGIDRLVAASDKENIATVRILNRLGFKFIEQVNIDRLGVVDKCELHKQEYRRSR